MNWYKTHCEPTVTKLQTDANDLPEGLIRKICLKNATDIVAAVNKIISKMKGNFDFEDVVNWRIMDFTGTPKNYTVDTDI